MKRLYLVLASCLLASMLFAQNSENEKSLFPAVWEVMMNIDGNYIVSINKADVANDVYSLQFVSYQKVLMSNQAVKYNAEYSITNTNGTKSINCVVTNMETCTVDGNRKPTTDWRPNMKSSMIKMAEALATRANNVYTNDASYTTYYNKSITDPTFLYFLTVDSPSTLWTKKFIEKNAIQGKSVEISVVISAIDESKYNDRAYVVTGNVIVDFNKLESVSVKLYTNDDKVAMLKTKQEYVIKGIVLDYFLDPLNKLSVLNIIAP